MAAATPVVAEVTIVSPATAEGETWLATTSVYIDPEEPVFAGHYPGFPIFPGVCIVELVHRSAKAAAPADVAALDLAAVESTRFTGAVYPEDLLTIELKWIRKNGAWRCTAVARTGRGDAASVRLRYNEKDGDS